MTKIKGKEQYYRYELMLNDRSHYDAVVWQTSEWNYLQNCLLVQRLQPEYIWPTLTYLSVEVTAKRRERIKI